MKQISEIRHSHASSLQTKHQDHTTGTRIESNSNSSDQDQDQDHQKTIKSVESKDLTPWKAYLRLWSYADRLDVILRSIGVASALGAGTAYPLMTMIFGDLVNEFNGAAVGAISPSEFRSAVNDKTLWFVYLFLGKFGLLYIANSLFCFTATRMTRRIRLSYLKTILHKPVSYFDHHSPGSVSSSLSADTNSIEVGLADKVACVFVAIGMIITAFAIGFSKSWKLTLVVGTTIPWVLTVTGILGSIDSKLQSRGKEAHSQASSLAGEALASVSNIMALGAKDKIIERFKKPLGVAGHWAIRDGPIQASLYGNMFFTMQSGYALALFYGVKLVSKGEIKDGGTVMVVLFCMMMGSSAMGLLAPSIPCFLKAAASSQQIFKSFTEDTLIPSTLNEKELELTHDSIEGSLKFQNVTFAYPKRPTVKVLDNFNLEILPNQTTAVVGYSGSGKSTLICLLERWYAPESGSILLGGQNISEMDVKWLRNQIGLVQQDPILFNDTIFQNVLNGLTDANHLTEQQQHDYVIDACKKSDAHQFIVNLPQGYDTIVGERGNLFSGGQKQRIAIARSIISNPKILLLDEATSSLDPESENAVKTALERASHGRTVLIIAHKLATVINADKIVVLNEGRIVEEGTHQELVALNGTYSHLLHAEDLRTQGKSGERNNKKRAKHEFTEFGQSKTKAAVDQKSEDSTSFQSRAIARQYSLARSMTRMLLQTKSAIPTFSGGTVGACIAGACIPMQAFLFSKLVTVFQLQGAQRINRGNFWAAMFFCLAATNLISYAILWFLFAISGTIISTKYRAQYLKAILSQDVSFFELPGNTSGALTALLSTDGDDMEAMFGFSIALLMVFLLDVVACGILAISVGWKLGLVGVFGCFPVLFLAGYFRMRLDSSAQDRCASNFLESARFGTEAIEAIRTISSLNMEDVVIERYSNRLRAAVATSIKKMMVNMILFSLSDSADFLAIALVFWYGGQLVSKGEMSTGDFFIVYTAIIFGGQGAGFIFGYSSGMSKAQGAINRILYLSQQQPIISFSAGCPEISPLADTLIEFQNVHFKYPTRLDAEVLRGINFKIERGENICIVGPSGCGKSTIIQLIERFYDVNSGALLIQGIPISSLDVEKFRTDLSLVSQETVLYQGTIHENLSMGVVGDVDDKTLVAACKDANIHDFIISLPEGYETECGARGLTLSGGQRQRIAIARALLRNPAILLLDEATSALDPESQRLIIDSLEKAAKGRTVISVSHHTEIMEHADRILVIEHGVVVESGRFRDLLLSKGRFWEMQGDLITND